MSLVNPYEPSQLQAILSAAESYPEEVNEREQRIFGARSQFLALGARYWLLGLLVHTGFALMGYIMYVVDWAIDEPTLYRPLGFAVLLIGIVISLFVQAAGQLQLCRWPPNLGAKWWFCAAFVSFFGMMVLTIGDLMLTLKYRENNDPLLWQLIEMERPTLLLSQFAVNLLLTIGLFQIGQRLQDRLLRISAALACLGGILWGLLSGYFELIGNTSQILREVSYLEPLEITAVIFAWLFVTLPLVVAMFRLHRLARRVAAVALPVTIDDPLAD